MRGQDDRTGQLFSSVNLEARIPPDHPLRKIRAVANEALDAIGPDLGALYCGIGRPSIPPERLSRAMLLQVFHSIRSERQLKERLAFDLLFRWFVGLSADEPVWNHSTFSKNRDRLLEGEIAARFLSAVLALPQVRRLLSSDHFSVDGTLIEAWASMKSVRPRDGSGPDDPPSSSGGRNAPADFRGDKRSNATHVSTTDPEARLYRKGPGMEAKLAYLGHGLMETRSGLFVDACVSQADGHAERIAALGMIEPFADRPRPITLGADRGYDAQDFVNELRSMNVRPLRQPRTSRAAAGGQPSTDGPPAIPATKPASGSASGSRRASAGSKGSPPCTAQAQGTAQARLVLHLRGRRLQSRAAAEAPGRRTVSGPRGCRVVGSWRIVEADLWDAEYLDLVQPAMLIIGSDGHGEIAFGAFQAGLAISYGTTTAFFTWSGFDEMDEVTGDGSVECLDDGSLEIEFNRHLGDEAVFTAVPAPSSTAF